MNRMCLKRSSVSLNLRVCFSSILRLSFISKRCRDITSEKNYTSNFSDQSRSQNDSHQSIDGHITIKLFQFSRGKVSQLFFSACIWVKRNMYHKTFLLTNKRQVSISDWILCFLHMELVQRFPWKYCDHLHDADFSQIQHSVVSKLICSSALLEDFLRKGWRIKIHRTMERSRRRITLT